MLHTHVDRDTQPWYRQPWPWFLISIPAAAVVAGFTLLYLAIHSPNSLVVDDYYQEGIAINQEIDRQKLAESLDIEGFLRADEREISFSFTDAGGRHPTSLTLRAIHATRADLDRTYTLEPADDNRYRAQWDPLPTGKWYFRIEPDDQTWEIRGQGRTEGSFQLRMTGEEQP